MNSRLNQTEINVYGMFNPSRTAGDILPPAYLCFRLAGWQALPKACHFASMAGVGNHQGSLTTLHI